jgi:hypothetical protein
MQEALGVMIDHALEDEEAFTQNFKELLPLKEDPARKMLENPNLGDSWFFYFFDFLVTI